MKLVMVGIVMLSCFAFANGHTTVAAVAPSVDEVTAPIEQIVDDGGEQAVTCGGRVCSAGTYCCNPSCGICVPKGMSCTQQSCN